MNVRALLIVTLALGLAVTGACGFGKTKAELASDAIQRGLQAHGAGRVDEAAAAYHEALDHEPRNKFALFNLGVVEHFAGRKRSAENYYRLALATDPNFFLALFNLAVVRAEAGDTREAIDLYREAIAQQPDDPGPHRNLGVLLRSIGQEADGDAELRRALELEARRG